MINRRFRDVTDDAEIEMPLIDTSGAGSAASVSSGSDHWNELFSFMGQEQPSIDNRQLDELTSSRTSSQRALEPYRSLKSVLVAPIPCNWSELLIVDAYYCIFHMFFRMQTVYTGNVVRTDRTHAVIGNVAGAGVPGDAATFSNAGLISNYIQVVNFTSIVYLLGAVSIRHILSIPYTVGVVVSAVTFTYLGYVPVFATTVSSDQVNDWSAGTITAYSAVGIVVVLCFVLQLRLAWRRSQPYLIAYATALAIVFTLHLALWLSLPNGIHLHHWYICWVFLLFLRSMDHPVIVALHSICSGIYLQGSAAYGVVNIIYTAL